MPTLVRFACPLCRSHEAELEIVKREGEWPRGRVVKHPMAGELGVLDRDVDLDFDASEYEITAECPLSGRVLFFGRRR